MDPTPTPLPSTSARFRLSRWEAVIYGPPAAGRTGRPIVERACFTSAADARRWADDTHPTPEASIVHYAAAGGWRPHVHQERAAEGWVLR